MPKMKSHSGAKKRFFATGKGKFSYRKSGKNHILEHKSPSRRCRLRKSGYVSDTLTDHLKVLLPYA
ncbi:MAG: 50S ribosomal protein L35 [Synergistaceae bacterium]|nr:50S ribosomal protein L35 [Synergistaceae bacterium]